MYCALINHQQMYRMSDNVILLCTGFKNDTNVVSAVVAFEKG